MAPPPAAVDVAGITDTQATTIPDPFSLPLRSNEIYGRRKKSLASQWGVAASAKSSSFKHATLKKKPKAKRWDRKNENHNGLKAID
jgi:aromatic amino acid aminotransferase I